MTDKLFTINEGEFYSRKNKFPKFIFRNKINFKIKFTLPPEYKLTTLNKQETETNNILTISDSLNHLKNSAGIGWKYNSISNTVELLLIVFVDYKKSIKIIDTLKEEDFYKTLDCKINIEKDFYEVIINKVIRFFPRFNKWKFIRYLIFPTFGNNSNFISKGAPKKFQFKITL